jgi:MoaA/NifB/PqqE/SkfB family radical SAM enzyme
LHKLSISLNTIDAALHPAIHGYPGASQLPDILEQLDRLLALPGARKKIQINYVMLADNYEERAEFLSWVRRKDLFAAVRPVGPALPALEERCLTRDQYETFLTELDAFEGDHHLSNNLKSTVRFARSTFRYQLRRWHAPASPPPPLASCYAGFYGGYILSNGNYYICCFAPSPMGNVTETRLRDLWRRPDVQGCVFAAATMQKTGRPLYPQCVRCRESRTYSRLFHAAFRRLPFQERAMSRKLRMLR